MSKNDSATYVPCISLESLDCIVVAQKWSPCGPLSNGIARADPIAISAVLRQLRCGLVSNNEANQIRRYKALRLY